MKKLILIAVFILAGQTGYNHYVALSTTAGAAGLSSLPSSSDAEFANAYKHRTSNLQIEGQGTVVKILPDDNDGSRHQRFIVRLNSGQTILIAHNIDLAPRVLFLKRNDIVRFYGQYKWHKKGGVIHWTHNDPRGSHVAGWIEHNGRIYQ
ncbi:MAG TPA: DUF3465 domain-containing protein [Geobacteraceae bacterium]